jgi:hypothetical protein
MREIWKDAWRKIGAALGREAEPEAPLAAQAAQQPLAADAQPGRQAEAVPFKKSTAEQQAAEEGAGGAAAPQPPQKGESERSIAASENAEDERSRAASENLSGACGAAAEPRRPLEGEEGHEVAKGFFLRVAAAGGGLTRSPCGRPP